jgi:hypothetical protein
MTCIKCTFFKIGEKISIVHFDFSPPDKITVTLDTISPKIINVLKQQSMVMAFEKWIKRERIPKFRSGMTMDAWGINNHDFLNPDGDLYICFDSELSGKPLQVIITETGLAGTLHKTLLPIKCYERLIKISDNEIIDTTEI